jgi:hypothetical protein
MVIRVFVDSISFENLKEILKIYNENKCSDEESLELLDRAEGGFKIKIPSKSNDVDENNKIRQVRWNQKCLITKSPYIGFTEYQETLLYEAMVHVLKKNVLLEN